MGVGVFTSSFTADEDQVALNQLSKWVRENWGVVPEGLKREFDLAKDEYNNLSFLDKEDEVAPSKIDFLIEEMNRDPDFANQVAASLPPPDFKVGERVSDSQYHGSGLARLASKAVIGALTSAATAGIGGALLGDSLANYGLQKILVDNALTNTLSGQIPDKPTEQIPDESPDDRMEAIDETLRTILTNAGKPGTGPKILQEQPVSVFNIPQAPPTIEEIAQARELEKPQDPTPDDQESGSNIPLFFPELGTDGTITEPQLPDEPTTEAERQNKDETKNPLLGVLALLGAGGLLGKTITKNEVDRDFKPNIPRVNSQGQRVYSDFDITINEPRLSLEKFRGKRLALPEFMT